ncbi:MAG: ATP-dependent RecD-like DNA helicase [Clostridia bacterium]|nr:ATP-dependent RecD-like DNA helicase [Clostridia bacterium]
MSDMENVTGDVVGIIYSNDDNGYKVMEIENDNDSFIAVGYFHGVAEGETVKLSGKWTSHPTYGEQFKSEVFEKILPATRSSIMRYLSSGIVKGIRESTAKKLVEKFGEDTLRVLEKEPESLSLIKGISISRAMKMHESYITQLGSSTLVMFLQDCGISVKTAAKIYKKFGSAAVEIIKSNPYILCEEIDGIGFKTADDVACKLNLEPDNINRVRAGVLYTLKYNTQFGHTYLPKDIIVSSSAKLLGVSEQMTLIALDALIKDGILVSDAGDDGEHIYIYSHYMCEGYAASKITELNKYKYKFKTADIEKQLDIIEKKHKLHFALLQRQAVISAMQNGVMIITGGPGTGKTTIINAIIDIMHSNGLTVSLTAPTGRAAKRMSQVCSLEAKTIHRLLEACFRGDEETTEFMVNEESPIESDVVIVDEMSMVDIVLISNLLKAIRPGTRLIMVGDINQLPSVGPGNVLRDIIESGTVEVIRLTEIFRQAQESMIVTNAHGINEGRYPVLNSKDKDFFFADIPGAAEGVKYIASLCSTRLPKAYGYDPFDIQVLSPSKKGTAGVINMNELLRDELNPPSDDKKEQDFGFRLFREGDKVMQIRNNYDIKWTNVNTTQLGNGVFNGDVGVISSIRKEFKTVTVMFDERKVVYEYKDIAEELELAYCVTIHKSQGSEFPVVIIPMYDAPYMLVNRNLLYTGVTRAKSLVVLVGREQIIHQMVDNNREDKRYSGLKKRLKANDVEILF